MVQACYTVETEVTRGSSAKVSSTYGLFSSPATPSTSMFHKKSGRTWYLKFHMHEVTLRETYLEMELVGDEIKFLALLLLMVEK